MINMEHPQLPKTIEDPPTQLWVMRKDVEASHAHPLRWLLELTLGLAGRNLLVQRRHQRQSAREACA